jgi:hypothetical protein
MEEAEPVYRGMAAFQTSVEPGGPRRGLAAILGWGGYLASSWTWVIGLLWPVLLVRDFGVWGWLAFAVPNVLGAAGFGYVTARPGLSETILGRDAHLAVRFSEVTIAFHVFAGGWVLMTLGGVWFVLGGVAAALVTWMVGFGAQRGLPWLGLGAAMLSLAMGVVWLVGGSMSETVTLDPTAHARRFGLTELIWFLPAPLVGFLLAPYLDLTFHRAQEATSAGTGEAAFTLGFAGLFLGLLVVALFYAGPLAGLFGGLPVEVPAWGRYLLAGHFALQAGVTTGFHLQEIGQRRGHAGLHRVVVLAAAGGALAFWAFQPGEEGLYGFSPAETGYRVFLLLYGLVFPAYVWLVMLPSRRGARMRDRVMVWLVALVVTVPAGYYYFLAEHFRVIGAALLVLLAARAAVEMLPGAEA